MSRVGLPPLHKQHGPIIGRTESYVIRFDGKTIVVHKLENEKEMRPRGYILGSNYMQPFEEIN